MAEPERDLDRLFAELGRTEPEPRDELAERARRRRISALIDARLAERVDVSSHAEPRSNRFKRHAAWAAVAAGAVLAVGGTLWRERTPFLTLEREPTTGVASGRARPNALGPAPPGPTRALGPAPATPPARAPERATASSARAPVAAASGHPVAPSPSGSNQELPASLAAQNELFQSAVRAARRGDDTTALAGFAALLERFPESPLAADARVRKFRTLSRLGRAADARAAASDYLARHPQGFARSEAEKLQQETTSSQELPSP
jgi:hypothetical protein